ncbi:MAG: hypothetical protein Q8O42_01695 [Acidobacteriota bacterium]|nr:hypothetical protein [Acidobacteriota bacterium]
MRYRGSRELVLVLLGALLLACLMTYPLIVGFDRVGRVDNNDGRWSIWVVSWVSHALTTDPIHLFRANIFYPHQDALAYSEANIAAGLVGVPVWLLTNNPYATHNFVLLVSFVVSFAGAYYLCRYLTGSRQAATVAGVLFAFCPFVFVRFAHIQLLLIGGLPFCMLAFHRLVDHPTVGRAVALGAILWFQGLACAYYGIFGGMAVGISSIVIAITRHRWRQWRYWAAIGGAAVVSIGLTIPFFLPYIALQRETGFARTLDGARTYSANLAAWTASGAWAHRWALDPSRTEVLFPGIVTLVLGLAGAFMGWKLTAARAERANPTEARLDRGVVISYIITGLVSFWITFGPQAGLYSVMYATVPVFSFLRAPGRTGILVTLCLTVLASIAMARLLERRRHAAWLAAGLMVLAIADLVQAPIGLREATPTPPAYLALARLPIAPTAVFPYWARGSDFHGHAEYMLASTAHWQPLINGYSDHIPQDFRDDSQILKGFPTVEAFAVLERLGVRYVVFHMDRYAGARDEVVGKIEVFAHYLRPIEKDGEVWLFEIVGWPR